MGAGLGLIGTAVSAAGTLAGGSAANQAAQAQAQGMMFNALQLRQAAAEARAVGNRAAIEKRREGRLVDSTLQARAAASGGGATDPTVLDLHGDLAKETEYQALTESYKGQAKAVSLENAATAANMGAQAAMAQGSAAQTAAGFGALGTIIGGAGSAYSKMSGVPVAPTAVATPGYSDPLGLNPAQNWWWR